MYASAYVWAKILMYLEERLSAVTVSAWLDDAEYGVVHRITSARDTRGVASFCLDWCFRRHGNIRIDTHEDNIPMQKCLLKNGYVRTGNIFLENGDPRIAFQKK